MSTPSHDAGGQYTSEEKHPTPSADSTKRDSLVTGVTPPDGGTRAWLVTLGGFFILMTSVGWLFAIGAFQAYYQSHQFQNQTPGTVSWITSLELFLVFFLAPFVSIAFTRIGARPLIIAGTIIHTFGLMMTSISKTFPEVVLAQGVCSPIGAALSYNTMLQVIPTWFQRKRGFAYGICTVGTSLGGVIFPIIVNKMVLSTGFGWTMRTIAFIMFGSQLVAIATVKSNGPPPRKAVDGAAFIITLKDPVFWLTGGGVFLNWLGFWIPFNYIAAYGLSQGMSFELAEYLIPILNGSGTPSRILLPALADHVGAFNINILCTFVTAVITLVGWILAKSNAAIIIFTAFFGFFGSALTPLQIAMVTNASKAEKYTPAYLALGVMLISLAALVSNPIAGALLALRGKWIDVQIFSGVLQMVSVVPLLLARFIRKRAVWAKI